MANEQISVRIQDNCNFTGKDIEEKAAELGLNKSEFVLKAVDMLLNFDKDFYKKVESYSKGLKTPEYIVIQNMIIKRMAMFAARTEVWGEASEHLDEFVSFMKNGKMEMITGNELFEFLKKHYIEEESKKKIKNKNEIEQWMTPEEKLNYDK